MDLDLWQQLFSDSYVERYPLDYYIPLEVERVEDQGITIFSITRFDASQTTEAILPIQSY